VDDDFAARARNIAAEAKLEAGRPAPACPLNSFKPRRCLHHATSIAG